MAGNKETFEFVIDAYTPETLPMARLAEYLVDLAALLGEKDRVHFMRVEDGTARLIHVVDEVAAPKVRARVAAARIMNPDSEERRAFTAIDRKLREDQTAAYLSEAKPNGAKLITFPGKNRDVDPEYGPFNEQGAIRGRVISVGGKRLIVNVNIQDGERIHFCDASRDVALQLAPYMFNYDVRVYGTGRYLRNPDGEWEMQKFRISHFEKLEQKPLAEVVERLRSVTRKVGLDRDIIKKLADFRGEPSEA